MCCNCNQLLECSLPGDEQCTCVVQVLSGCGQDDCIKCCDTAMKKVEFKTQDQGKEKHVPVVEKVEGGYKVKVGEVAHPMEEDHYITMIEMTTKDELIRKCLKPGMAPEAVFYTNSEVVQVVERCNKHGFWKV